MKKYEVIIKEELSKAITVEAKDENDAMQKVRTLYFEGEIVLDAENFIDVEFLL